MIFLGGAVGALLRYSILSGLNSYPINVIGVMAVNFLGCFFIGLVSYIAIKKYNLISDKLNKFLTVGFAGGFTTFSAFSQPVLEMLIKHHYMYATLNMFISVIGGLILVAWGMNCGYYIMNYLIKTKRLKFRRDY